MNTTVKVFGGLLLGAAIGAVAGMLITPSSGKKTLKSFDKKSKVLKKFITEAVSTYLDSKKDLYNSKVDSYAKNGKNTIDSIKENVKL